ncbi:MAG: response regulator transcription factor [Rhodomicrobium sp.]
MRILVIEDDKDLSRQLTAALRDAGYAADAAFDGDEGYYLGENEPYDTIILDLGLPKVDGLSILERWRAKNIKTPVLILTARDRWSEKVSGINAGADDYVAKPFQMEEVIARVRALLRRSAGFAKAELECGPLRLDTRTARVTFDGAAIKVTGLEFRLLSYLMHHQSRVVSRSELVDHLYQQDFDRDSNTIEVFIGRLRRKIPADLIHTVRGLGYCVSAADPRSDVSS